MFYKKILNRHQFYSNCHFVIYEKLTNPDYMKKIFKKINLKNIDISDLEYFKNFSRQEIKINYSKDINENARNIYLSILKV